uniref:NTF2 domain-containing protein n=1 Tax=Globodera pallida TaxID=36090 RepID=A0A183BJK7_GLOPA
MFFEKENDIAAAVPNNTENNANAAATDPAALAPAKDVPVNNDKHNVEDLMGLARFFLKEYYTKLSDRPEDAGNYYGSDSHFVHGDVEETGRENIQRAIANMGFDCKARFYSLKTVALLMQGDNAKLIQVCGELTLVKAAVQKQLPVIPRRFVQTIILAHQTPTMLYVKSDVFQWLDTAFHITAGEKYNAANNAGATVPSPPTIVVEQQQQPLENGDNKTLPMVNGGNGQFHQIVADVETKKAPVPVDQPHKVAEEEKVAPIVPTPQMEPEMKPTANVVAAAAAYNAANNAGATVPSPPTTVVEQQQQQPLENGDNKTLPMVNGGNGQFHQIVADVETKKAPVSVDQPHKVAEEEKAAPIVPTPQMEPEMKPTANVVAAAAAVESLPSPPSSPNKKDEEAAAVATGPPPPPAVVDGPKTHNIQQQQQQPPSSESVSVNVSAATVAVLPPPPVQQQPASVAVATTAVVTSLGAKPKTVVSGSYAAIAAAAKGQPMPPSKIVSYHQPHKVPENVANFNSSNGNAPTPSASTAVPTMTASNKPMPPPPQQQQQKPPLQQQKPPPQQQQKPPPVQQKPPPVQQVTPLPQQQQQMDNGNANDGSKQSPPLALPPVVNVAPRREWAHRIYFTQLTKPGRFVDFKLGQQELMREIQAIANGVEFVGIKPNSLRREYRTAFGFIDFTTSADMQAVYDACKRDPSGAYVLNVRIPEFDFNDGLLLSADKTNNLGGGGYGGGGGGGYR